VAVAAEGFLAAVDLVGHSRHEEEEAAAETEKDDLAAEVGLAAAVGCCSEDCAPAYNLVAVPLAGFLDTVLVAVAVALAHY